VAEFGADESGEEMRRALAEELLRMRPRDLLGQTAVMLANQAAIRIGLASPEQADRAQAREAIDALAGIVELLAPLSPPEELEALRADLAQLRMAFVQSQGSAPATGPEPEAGPDAGPADDGPDEERPSIWTPGGEV
jgi:Domain of unknown function (DUF1844)